MSRMAFFTRVLVFSQAPLPSRSTCGRAASPLEYFWIRSNASTGTLSLSPRLVAEHHQLARRAADVERLEAEEAADAVLLVHHQVAHLEVPEVGEEGAQPAPAAARVQVHFLGEDVPVGEQHEAGGRDLESPRQSTHARQDPRPLAHGEALVAQHVAQAVGAPLVAEEDDRRGLRLAQVGGEARHVPRVARGGTRGDVQRRAPGLDLAHAHDGHPRQVLRECLRRDERLGDLGLQALAPARAILARPRHEPLQPPAPRPPARRGPPWWRRAGAATAGRSRRARAAEGRRARRARGRARARPGTARARAGPRSAASGRPAAPRAASAWQRDRRAAASRRSRSRPWRAACRGRSGAGSPPCRRRARSAPAPSRPRGRRRGCRPGAPPGPGPSPGPRARSRPRRAPRAGSRASSRRLCAR